VLSLFLTLLAPLGLAAPALLAPALSAEPAPGEEEADAGVLGAPAQQVRIEQGIIIRIPPGSARPPLSPPPEVRRAPRWRERPAGQCLPLWAIGGLRIEDDRNLLLFMRDRRLVRAQLDRTCSAGEFASGFYIEQSDDAQLCAGRDMLRSRRGASCALVSLRLLVPAGR
jgi:hypothetical protein